MITIYNRSTDPYFNLAAEEYLLRNTDDDIFMLWRNCPSVIIGKNQNTWAEVNTEFVRENKINVARRITGGGAVFHDLGNVNFSFITEAADKTKLNFEKFTSPIIKALGKMGVTAVLDGRNDITADGCKISGNAQCVIRAASGKERILHHGTLLFSADISYLADALKVSETKIKSKGIKSVRSRVKNITELENYSGTCDVLDFIDALFSEIGETSPRGLTENERKEITKLRDEKFSSWEWIWGVSPDFEIHREKRFGFGTVSALVKAGGGIIEDIRFYGDFFGSGNLAPLEKALAGIPFERGSVLRSLSPIKDILGGCIAGATPEDIADLLF